MKRALIILLTACCGAPATPPTTTPTPRPALLGRSAPALVCPAGTTMFQVPPEGSCAGYVFDYPGPRHCAAREQYVCKHRFGTSEEGSAEVCRAADGKEQGPFQVREHDGSVIAEGTCRAGVLDGPLYRWRAGALSEVIPMREGGPDGLYMRWEGGRLVDSAEYVDGVRAGAR